MKQSSLGGSVVGLLPAGVTVRQSGAVAWLEFADEATAMAYRATVGAGDNLRLSRYLLRPWGEDLGGDWVLLIATLQEMALSVDRPTAPLGQLGRAIRRSEDTVRRMLRWWGEEREGEVAWEGARGYLPQIGECSRARGGSPTYAFTVLEGDVLHPSDRATFERLVAGGPAQPRLPGAAVRVANCAQIATLAGEPGSQSATLEAPYGPRRVANCDPGPPPTPPMIMHADHSAASAKSTGELRPGAEHAGENLLAAAAAALENAGVPAVVALALLRLPDGAAWSLRWCEWLPFVATKPRNRVGFLVAAIRGACEGDPQWTAAPVEWELRRSPVAPVRVAKSVEPERAALVVEAAAADRWGQLVAALGAASPVVALLRSAVRVELDGAVLVVQCDAVLGELLRRSLSKVDLGGREVRVVSGAGAVEAVGA